MLHGIARQTFSTMPRPILHIVIADNECSDRTRQICVEFDASLRHPDHLCFGTQARHFLRSQRLPRQHP